MTKLAQEKCIPCKGDTPPMTDAEIVNLKNDVPEWQVIEVDGIPRLERRFKFQNFVDALDFVNAVGKIAEEQDHHPLITLTWGEATIDWWTHAINGLHKNDFIMAAKTDELYR